MSYKSVIISSGHGLHVRGAAGILDEVTEARKVVDKVAEKLIKRGVKVKTFHDDTSKDQATNLSTIVDFHNAQDRQLDISVHFNAYVETQNPMGVECLFVSQEDLATMISHEISVAARFINRGAKLRNDLAFLNGTNKPSILIETCFVDSEKDADLYGRYFEQICEAIAETLSPGEGGEPAPPTGSFTAKGKCSQFGGPLDSGVGEAENLAFIFSVEDAPHLFLPFQPPGTTGLARRLNSAAVAYCACRFDYDVTPHEMLLSNVALVRAENGKEILCFPSDWGPHVDTDRVVDLSPYACRCLGIITDDVVEVIFPAPED